jgi:4-hydroxy-2-oxovalerate aldolase
MTPQVRIVDTTLRDGSHSIKHRLTPEQVGYLAGRLDAAGVWAVVVGHGDGLGGGSLHFGFAPHSDEELVGAAAAAAKNAKIATLIIPGLGTRRDLESAATAGATMVRVGSVCTEADTGAQHLGFARELGLEAHTMLGMIHSADAGRIAENGAIAAAAGAQAVGLVDSAGGLMRDEVKVRVAAMRAKLPDDVAVSFHAHNNLSLAVANSVAAVEEGATMVDVSLAGMGAGAGNCQSEALVAVLHRLGIETGVDLFTLQDAADNFVRTELMPGHVVVDGLNATLGFSGVPAALLLHIQRQAERFGVDPRELIVALGERKATIGQEDLVTEVAASMAGGR